MKSKPRFRVGQKVRPSPYGVASTLFPGAKATRAGRVVKVDEFGDPTILWEGRKTASSYHQKFIAPVRDKRP
jgi:hypothetical protein